MATKDRPEGVRDIGREVLDEYDDLRRRFVWSVVAGLLTYAILAVSSGMLSWSKAHESAPVMLVPLTIGRSDGAAILAVLASLVVALNVAVWTSRTTNGPASFIHARSQLLSEAGLAVSSASLLVGAAVLFQDAPRVMDFAGRLPLAIGAVVIALLATDASFALDLDKDIEEAVATKRREREATVLRAAAARLDDGRDGRKRKRRWLDGVFVAATSAAPLIAWIGVFGVEHDSLPARVWFCVLAFLLTCMSTAVGLYVAYGAAWSFMRRKHSLLLVQVLTGVIWYSSMGVVVFATANWPDRSVGASIGLAATVAIATFGPLALIAAGLLWKGSILPGRTARQSLRSSLVERAILLEKLNSGGPTANDRAERFGRIRRRYRRVTGLDALDTEQPVAAPLEAELSATDETR
ncbi:hypothetical protein [Antrihabitans cavernicola]|uniref:Uncharacterized protein n=1 Tax=Antrihabitans cavernicola TaxID=2495913 RepID=A0A5A7SF84_9NOCA|nr:hypothetical protein [Spelaeibacter cavernicola]KAA0024778.1 hypothetical protein FOY51_02255 [Spelaeibacter cavernicola]